VPSLPPFEASTNNGKKFMFWTNGKKYFVKRLDQNGNIVTIPPSGREYIHVYDLNGERECGTSNYNDPNFDPYFPAWGTQRKQQNGVGPRPKKTKKQALLPDGKIYDLFKSGRKWYVEREFQSGSKRLVLVHPKK